MNFFSFVENPFTNEAKLDYKQLYWVAYEQQRLADIYSQTGATAQQQLGQGRQDVMGALGLAGQQAGQYLGQARGDVKQSIGQGRGDVLSQLQVGRGDVRASTEQGIGAIQAGTDAATGRLDPYAQTGQGALNVEAARAGAYGPEAQAQAFADYQSSPGQQWFQDQQEEALLRNASATGGLRGGSTQTALQEQAMGRASTNYQQDLMNLRSLGERGQAAAGQQGQFESVGGRLKVSYTVNKAVNSQD